jgi:HEAT repeat protein
MIALLAILLQASDKDADEALKTFKAALAKADAPARTAAAAAALETPHERVIRAVAELLATDTEDVRIGVASALGDTDHPAAVEALVHAMAANEKRPAVASAISTALGELGWQAACPVLEALLRRAGLDDVREFLPPAIEALGRLGSATSVDPLLDLVRLFEGPRRVPWKGEGEIRRKAEAAVVAITGAEGRNSREVEAWWKANATALRAGARKIWWLKKTGERVETGSADKAPPDATLVATRLVEPPAERPAKTKKKKR